MVEVLIVTVAVMFIAAGALLLVANHFGLSPIPFYLIAGLITGPFVVRDDILILAQWGIAFLVFVFGVRIDLEDTRSVLRDAEIAALTQIVIIAPLSFGLGYLFADLLGLAEPIRNAIYFSAAVVLSSTLVGSVVLETEIRRNLVHGRLASAVHLFDDLVGLVLVLVLSVEVLTADAAVTALGYGLVFVVAGLAIGRYGFTVLERLADGDSELVLLGSISILIGFIAAAEFVEISIVIAAFAAGLAIPTTGTKTLEVRNGINALRDFFAAIFFVTVGALVTLPSIEVAAIALALTLFVFVINPVIYVGAFLYEGYDDRTAFFAGTTLNQVSEFTLILAIQAFLLQTISEVLFEAIILTAAVTMILTSVVRRYEQQLFTVVKPLLPRHPTSRIDEASAVESNLTDHVVILGYGRQGRRLTRTLDELDQPYVVIDNDPGIYDDLRSDCDNFVFGDAMSAYTWEKAGISDARLVCSTVNHQPVSETILSLDTAADLIVRSDDPGTVESFLDAGATYVIVPDRLAGSQLTEIIDKLLTEDDHTQLQENHLEYLQLLEDQGLEGRAERL